jgi:hypothetical protein
LAPTAYTLTELFEASVRDEVAGAVEGEREGDRVVRRGDDRRRSEPSVVADREDLEGVARGLGRDDEVLAVGRVADLAGPMQVVRRRGVAEAEGANLRAVGVDVAPKRRNCSTEPAPPLLRIDRYLPCAATETGNCPPEGSCWR